jgi:hypothetical protein
MIDIMDDYLKLGNVDRNVLSGSGLTCSLNGVNKMKKSFGQIITTAVQCVKIILHKFFRSSSKTARQNTREQQMLIDYFERRISLSDDLANILIGIYSVEDCTCIHIVVRHMLRGNPRVIALFLHSLKSHETDPRLIEGLSSACVVENVRFPLQEVIAAYTKACELEQNINRFDEFVGFFYNTLKPKGFDALLALRSPLGFNSLAFRRLFSLRTQADKITLCRGVTEKLHMLFMNANTTFVGCQNTGIRY